MDHTIEKVVYVVFNIYIFDFILHLYNALINIKHFLIHYLCSEILIAVFLNLLSNNNKY